MTGNKPTPPVEQEIDKTLSKLLMNNTLITLIVATIATIIIYFR